MDSLTSAAAPAELSALHTARIRRDLQALLQLLAPQPPSPRPAAPTALWFWAE